MISEKRVGEMMDRSDENSSTLFISFTHHGERVRAGTERERTSSILCGDANTGTKGQEQRCV